ncbi:hypothetical protein QBC40DRAFT_271573 [Triangularia verruculosa]|uniref:Uncharacterized protein n=1 Tax=Triangularia verruculosa TaxID=2587418 RepID=A0AAN7AZI1_9PEZI|nr:hypothetical protein QBC40DRAFT_271573 [Triangularia verruculosa]
MRASLRSAWNKLLLKAMRKGPRSPRIPNSTSASSLNSQSAHSEDEPPTPPPTPPRYSRVSHELPLSELISQSQPQSQPDRRPTYTPCVSPYVARPLPYMSNNTIRSAPPTQRERDIDRQLEHFRPLYREWRLVARHHFGEELGQYYHDPESNPEEKPEVYTTLGNGDLPERGNWTVCNVPRYQHRYNDNHPPPYDWVQASQLPLPVEIDESWSSLHAAQRELNRLRHVDAYVSNRLKYLNRELQETMDKKLKEDTWLDSRYVWAQRRGMLHAVGLGDVEQSEEHVDWERHGCRGPPPDGAEGTDWVFDVDKSIIVRERLSGVGLFSPRYGHHTFPAPPQAT